jgi:AAHS family 3-hydroxyphenylpropionic acid transporter
MSANQSRGPWLTVLLCLAVAILEGFDIQVLGVAMPRMSPALGLEPLQKGWVFAFSNIGLVVGASIGGWLADRLGRRPVFTGAVLGFGVFTLATSLVQTPEQLCAVRLLAGLGFGAVMPNMMAVAAEISAPGRRAFTTAAMFCGLPLGGGISALLTQLLPADFDWRTLFIIGGAMPLLLVPVLHLFLPETLPMAERQMGHTPRTPLREVLFGQGRAVPSVLLWCIFLPTLVALYLILNWLPTLVEAKGFSKAVAPQASIAFNFASVIGALVIGWAVDRLGGRWILAVAYACVILGLFQLGAATDLDAVLWLSAAVGFFLMGANYSLYGLATAYYPISIRGTGSGVAVGVGRVGSVLGPLVPGLLLQGGMSAADVILLMAPTTAVAGLAVFLLGYFPPAKG